jgi:23S rRNA (adenine2503-C2)-methyltransferase
MEEHNYLIPSLYAYNPTQLAKELSLDKNYQGKQIYQWLIKGISNFDEMTTLSKELRSKLSSLPIKIRSSRVIEKQTDSSGATKIAIELEDKNIIEAVLLVDKDNRRTACLSSQVGCAMGCSFCRTATMGLLRNLKSYEIIEQFVHLKELGDDITNIVYMGMGEPLANIQEVSDSITYLNDPDGFNIGLRRITVSTCGVVKGINYLTKAELPVRLAVSLIVADDNKRELLMPINKTYPLSKLKKALLDYQRIKAKRFTLEYVMLSEFNTSQEDAKNLATFIKDLDVIVNLIPWNPAAELPYQSPSTREINNFITHLEYYKIPYSQRFSRGRGINGACGQLATKKRQSQS